MNRGITEKDVFTACDALLLGGQRPTIERVRQKIGRGSPNTVSPMLDTWFKGLGARIKDPGAFAASPDVPDPILQAARHFWEVAQAEGRRDLEVRVTEGMAAAVANVESEKEKAAVAEAAAFEALSRARRLQSELTDHLAMLDQEKLARTAVEAHLQSARHRIEELTARAAELERVLDDVRKTAAGAVAAAEERSAAAERRAAVEIDAARASRSRAESRADALEHKLEAAHELARVTHVRHTEEAVRHQAEVTRLSEEVLRTEDREAALQVRLQELSANLGELRMEAHAARSQADLAERVIASLNPGRPAPRTRAAKT